MSVTRALRDAHKCKCSEGQAMSLYGIKVIRSLDRDTAELYYVQTDELIARGTPEEIEKLLARLIREATQEGTDGR
jgi:hypothetical protein